MNRREQVEATILIIGGLGGVAVYAFLSFLSRAIPHAWLALAATALFMVGWGTYLVRKALRTTLEERKEIVKRTTRTGIALVLMVFGIIGSAYLLDSDRASLMTVGIMTLSGTVLGTIWYFACESSALPHEE